MHDVVRTRRIRVDVVMRSAGSDHEQEETVKLIKMKSEASAKRHEYRD